MNTCNQHIASVNKSTDTKARYSPHLHYFLGALCDSVVRFYIYNRLIRAAKKPSILWRCGQVRNMP